MFKNKLKFLFVVSLMIFFFSTGYILVKSYPTFKNSNIEIENNQPIEVTLEFWGLWDNSDDWKEIKNKFEKKTYNLNGHEVKVSVNYTKKDFNTYQEDILKARGNNNSPNIFMINNNWFGQYVDFLEPLENNSAYEKEYNLISYQEVQDIFPMSVLRDVVHQERLYGIPLYSDSLALFYNKDLFEKFEIENLPKSWEEFNQVVKKLTVLNYKDEIVQAGVAFGTGKNVNRSSDIISLLIMQGGGEIITEDGKININKEIEINTIKGVEKRFPGKRGIEFYTEFANPRKEIYSWNFSQEDSLNSFAKGKVAMIFGYSYYIKNLIALNSDLNYGISLMPQLQNSTSVNFSNVTIPVVSRFNHCKVEPSELAGEIDCAKISWSFLSFASEKENSRNYLNSSGKVASRTDLIQEQIALNNKISVFASQVKNSQSYNKFDDRIDNILVKMLDDINLDRKKIDKIIDFAAEEINNLK